MDGAEQLSPDDVAPIGEQDTCEKLRSPGHTIFRFRDDEVYWLRVAEVLAVDLDNGTAELWYYLRSRQHSTKKWHEPLVLSPHHPEYYDERSPGTSHLKPKKDKISHLRRRQGQVDKTDVEAVVPYFLLETAGKVPRKVCAATETSICGGNTRRAPMSRPSRSLSPQKKRSSCRSNSQPHYDGPEGANEGKKL